MHRTASVPASEVQRLSRGVFPQFGKALRKSALLIFSSALCLGLLTSCATKKPWQAEGVSEIRVLTANSEAKGTFDQPSVVKEVVEAFGRAMPSNPMDGLSRPWTYKIDVVGLTPESGRWLYSPKTGEFVRLKMTEAIVFRLFRVDQARVEQLLEIEPEEKDKEKNQDPIRSL